MAAAAAALPMEVPGDVLGTSGSFDNDSANIESTILISKKKEGKAT